MTEGAREESCDYPDEEEEEVDSPSPAAISPNQHSSVENVKRVVQKADSTASIKSRTSSKISYYIRSPSNADSDGDTVSNDLTETEVEVSERTSKFKISTETNKPSSRRNSYERSTSLDGRGNSFDRTVSPKQLEECLIIHVETTAEHEPEEVFTEETESTPVKDTTIFQKIKNFSGRMGYNEKDKTNTSSTEDEKNALEKKGVLKCTRSKSESSKHKNQCFSISKPKITFAANTEKTKEEIENKGTNIKNEENVPLKSKENDLVTEIKTSTSLELQKLKKKSPESSITCSPTLSEKNTAPSNFIFRQKKFSLSLDMLPRKNGRTQKNTNTPRNTPGSSEDNLLSTEPSRSGTPDQVKSSSGTISSPKTLKKRHETAKELLLKSFSFKKRAPLKSEVSKDSSDSFMDKPKESL